VAITKCIPAARDKIERQLAVLQEQIINHNLPKSPLAKGHGLSLCLQVSVRRGKNDLITLMIAIVVRGACNFATDSSEEIESSTYC